KSTLRRSNHLSSPLPTALWVTRVPSSRCGRSARAGGVVVDVMGSPQTVLGECAGQLVHGDQQQDVDDGVEQPHCRRVAVLALEQTGLVDERLDDVGRARVEVVAHQQHLLEADGHEAADVEDDQYDYSWQDCGDVHVMVQLTSSL